MESGRSSKIIFLITSIDRIEVLINRKSWNLNFHKENSRTHISTLFILQMNTLQPYIISTTYSCIYLYIYNNTSLLVGCEKQVVWLYIMMDFSLP